VAAQLSRRKLPASSSTSTVSGPCTTRLDGVELATQLGAYHRDAPIARGQILLGVQGDRALADHGLPVPGELAVLFLGELPPVLAVHLGAHPVEGVGCVDPGDGEDPEMGVVGGEHPADRFDPLVAADPGVRHDT
jgi:hypothetical protein